MPSGASKWDVSALTPGIYIVAGSFDTNGTSSPADVKGVGVAVVRTGVGVYELSLTDPFRKIISCTVSPQCVTAALFSVELGAYTEASRKIEIRTLKQDAVSGIEAVANVAADANNRIHFTLNLAGSSNTKV
jgi:hypothetical protein